MFDKRQDDSQLFFAPPPLTLITYRLQLMSNLISTECYPIFPIIASKGSYSGVDFDEPDKLGLVLISLLINNVSAAERLRVVVPLL